jgi:hypothetical protein
MKAIGLPTNAMRVSEPDVRLDAAATELRRGGRRDFGPFPGPPLPSIAHLYSKT